MSTGATTPAPEPANQHRPLAIDLDRVEKIVNRLETRSDARSKYRPPPKSRRSLSKAVLIWLLFAAWAGSLVVAFVHIYFTASPDKEFHPTRRIIAAAKPKAAGSVEQSAKKQKTAAKLQCPQLVLSESPDAATLSTPGDLAVPHRTPDGAVDYWLIPRSYTSDSHVKVNFVGKSKNGFVVQSLEDGRYYTVTAAGKWRSIPISNIAER